MQKGFVQFILLGVAVLAIVAAGAFYLGRQTLPSPKPPPSQSQVVTYQITPSSTPASDGTVNWKTYTNTRYGFGFRYPQNYIVDAIDITTNPNCDYLTNAQSSCLIILSLKASDSDYAPKASFHLLKGINAINIPGQVSSISFDQQKKSWVFNKPVPPAEMLSVWDQTKLGQGIIKSSNGGSHGSSFYYIIPNYKNDEVAIFAIPQSYRLRCDNFVYLNDIPKQTQCNYFYNDVIQKYNGGQTTQDTWLPESYIKTLYIDAETMVRSFNFP